MPRRLTIALLDRPDDPCSLRIYQEAIVAELAADVDFRRVKPGAAARAACDLIWEPALAMRRVAGALRRARRPIVATMHGVKAFALPLRELETTPLRRLGLWALKQAVARDWRWFGDKLTRLIAVSHYSAAETARAFGLAPPKIVAIHHGVDRRIFHPQGPSAAHPRPYVLSIASPNPIKNLDRLFAAHARLPATTRPDLVAIVPGARQPAPPGVHLVRQTLAPAEIAAWCRGARALVFPSLRETFGLPILEAMSCGCPVVTSRDTGCAEVAGDAALLVDPRATDEIARAIARVSHEPLLRTQLIAAGFARVDSFSWERSARAHLDVFNLAAGRHPLVPERVAS